MRMAVNGSFVTLRGADIHCVRAGGPSYCLSYTIAARNSLQIEPFGDKLFDVHGNYPLLRQGL
jgi:hypothetical protein